MILMRPTGTEVSGEHPLTGLMVQLYDHTERNASDPVRMQEYREDVPSDGDWYIDLIKRDGNVQIDGTFLGAGEMFSLVAMKSLLSSKQKLAKIEMISI